VVSLSTDSASTDPARDDLELGRLHEALARRTTSRAGRELASALPLLPGAAAVREALRSIEELRVLSRSGGALPLADFAPIDETLARVGSGALAPVADLHRVFVAAKLFVELDRALRREALPTLAGACPFDPTLGPLVLELAPTFAADGSLSDDASPGLAEARSEHRSAKAHLTERLDELIRKYAASLSGSYWTERDGRFVLPVRSDAHDRFPGIVHAASSGGATLFVEPRVLVGHGNRLKVLDARVAKEEELVQRAVGERLRRSGDALRRAAEAYALADVRHAAARLAEAWDCRVPEVGPPSLGLSLPRARHPLLLEEGVTVVPSDLELSPGRALVISGPNAGGKTVALKTFGLLALMARLGLPLPTGDGARVGLFDEILTDVGDQQSLSKNLSTFSAHIQNVAGIVRAASGSSLVLLDELASGTDPREGEALASAILLGLAEAGATVACTTHYEALKALAAREPTLENASAGFDLATLTPTFVIHRGIPGPSAALTVARRFGIPERLCARAESLRAEGSLDVERLLADVFEEKHRLEKDRRELDRLLEKARADLDAFAAERRRWEERDERAVQRETEALLAAVKRAREDLRVAELRMKSAALEAKELAALTAVVDGVARSVAIGGPLEPPRKEPKVEAVAKSALFPGARVYVPKLRTEADVLEILANGQVRVAAGPMKLLVAADELRRTEKSGAKNDAKSKQTQARAATKPSKLSFDAAADPDVPIQTAENTTDLRGLRAHEAIAQAEQFLDSCVRRGLSVAFLIHGHGTGALRQALRETLQSSGYVAKSRPGEPREGGDGVTVVWLR
jgi:DNA mismatch repair protein MutS2